jgi:sn-glycerol 3-phosphate transport system ATP-binding protein
MVENQRWLDILAHAVLIIGVVLVAFPVYVAIIASTHEPSAFATGTIPLLPGDNVVTSYTAVLEGGVSSQLAVPISLMLFNSMVMALLIAVGKIAISIVSAFAIVYFRFPFRVLAFWLIFITLMLPVEVRILPTYEVIADLGMLNSYAGLTVPLMASATATFLFRQVFLTIPDELMEAARIDRRGPDEVLPRHPAAHVADQHRGALRHPLHLRLEPVSLAHPRDDGRQLLHHRRRHQAHGRRRRQRTELELHHGRHGSGHAAARRGGDDDAEAFREGPRGQREIIMAELTLSNVGKTYPGGVVAVKGASFDIADGEFIVLVGPSGCGKSTILRMIAGLEVITQGEVSIAGRVVNKLEPAERDIAMVFQNYALYPHMTVRRNMEYGLRNQGTPRDEIDRRIAEAARTLQIEQYLDRKPRALSGGQRQRVAMGRAIVREPAVFLFDEPLSNLDAKLRTQLRAELKDLHTRLGATFVFVTHDQVEAMSLADRIVIMSEGKDRTDRHAHGPLPQPRQPLRGRVHRRAADERLPPRLPRRPRARGPCRRCAARRGPRRHPARTTPHRRDGPQGDVMLVEALGAESLIHLRIGEDRMILRGGHDSRVWTPRPSPSRGRGSTSGPTPRRDDLLRQGRTRDGKRQARALPRVVE